MELNLDDFLKKPLMAHLATSSIDGARHSPVWFLWEEKAIWLIGNTNDSFPKRIKKDARCAIGIVDFDLQKGVLKHVGFRGTAQIIELDENKLDRLLIRYLGENKDDWNQWFKTTVIDNLNLMVKFIPESTVVRNQSYFL